MAQMYSQADYMADELTLYTTLQGITMQMLTLRLIKVLSAQKRLSILTTTAVKVGYYCCHVGCSSTNDSRNSNKYEKSC